MRLKESAVYKNEFKRTLYYKVNQRIPHHCYLLSTPPLPIAKALQRFSGLCGACSATPRRARLRRYNPQTTASAAAASPGLLGNVRPSLFGGSVWRKQEELLCFIEYRAALYRLSKEELNFDFPYLIPFHEKTFTPPTKPFTFSC
jgi:hypothetical protein